MNIKRNFLTVIFGFILCSTIKSQVKITINNLDEKLPYGILDLRNTTDEGKILPIILPSSNNQNNIVSPNGNLAIGSIYYDSNEKKIKLYNGKEWKKL